MNTNTRKLIDAQDKLVRSRTSHVFHLLMSIITIGFWIPVWALVALSNSLERRRLLGVIDKASNN